MLSCEIWGVKVSFSPKGYFDALATYIHEMCHVFGSDFSNAFSQGLTSAMETLLANAPMIESYRQQWLMQYRGVDGIEIRNGD